MIIRRIVAPVSLAAFALVGVGVGPTAAGTGADPGIKIAKPGGPYIRILTRNLDPGQTKTQYLKAKNGTDESAEFLLVNDLQIGAGYKPKWFYKGTNITQDVVNDGYDLELKPGRARKFKLTVKRSEVSDADACILTSLRKPNLDHQDTAFLQFNSEFSCP